MNIFKHVFIGTILLVANITSAAPIDYNNDSYSDPSTVVAGTSLKWDSIIQNETETVLESFGQAGQHLVPGKYSSRKTQPATVDSNGVWRISNDSSINFGDSDSVFIAGADFDGDDRTDLAYASNACVNINSTFSILTNPLGETPIYREVNATRGANFKTYLDSNNDNIDEICSLLPIKISHKITNKFKIQCTNVISNTSSVRFTVGRVNNVPVRVKVKNQPDLLMIYDQTAAETRFRLLNMQGQVVDRLAINHLGTIVIGNFTSQESEQIAIVDNNGLAKVYDVLIKSISDLTFPDGIPYDQVNIVNFKDNQDCFCSTKSIARNKSCRTNSTKPEVPIEEVKEFYIPDNCSNPPEHISYNDGFKCIASSTRGGSIVCVLPYQFTWEPYHNVTDHHNMTYACNKNDAHFDSVNLVLKSGDRIPLDFAYCANYVATVDGPIGRQHFRNENYQWSSVSHKVASIEMVRGDQKTCLRF